MRIKPLRFHNNMKTKTYSSLSLDVPLLVPDSMQEFDLNAKRENACLDEATNNVVYRSSLAEFREVFLHGRKEEKDANGNVTSPAIDGVEQITGITRKSVEKELTTKDEDGKPKVVDVYDESEAVYFRRVCAQLAGDRKQPLDEVIKSFQPLANTVAATIKFDASAEARQPSGPKKLPKSYIEAAKKVIDAGKGQHVAALLKESLNRDVEVTVEGLAAAMQEDVAQEAKRRRARLGIE